MKDYEKYCPVGTLVNIIHPIGSKNEGWLVVPHQRSVDPVPLPEGYEIERGWGRVTGYDENHPRARGGDAPVVVEEFIFCGFDKKIWEACK